MNSEIPLMNPYVYRRLSKEQTYFFESHLEDIEDDVSYVTKDKGVKYVTIK
jgi:hypothetical protein